MGKIYFVSAPGRIKVGFTKQPERRLTQLRTADMEPLEVLAITDGTRDDERGLHEYLQSHHLRGEWFADNEHVREAMALFMTGVLKFEQEPPPAPVGRLIDREHDAKMAVVNTALAEVRFLTQEIRLRQDRHECSLDLVWFAKFLVDNVLGPLLYVPADTRVENMHIHGFDPPK